MINRTNSGAKPRGQAGEKGTGREGRGEATLGLNDLVTVFHFLIPSRTETMLVFTSLSTVNLVVLLQIPVRPFRLPAPVRSSKSEEL